MYKILLLSNLLLISLYAVSQKTDSISLIDETVYEKVDSVASFPGGKQAWYKFVGDNLNAAVGIDNGAKTGTYKVKVKFTVMKDGSLKDFEPVTKFKRGFEEEVIRMMKLSPNWIPAKKDGVIVNSKVVQEQVFVISEG